ncbi:MAG: flagellar filament capping protein FliD [Phycisphaerae bacterium]|nr:flagellar filament capping protein FliD [Phycisphaerae bacterium]
MPTLRLPGLQSGIDTGALVEQLMLLERRTLNRWEDRKSLWEERQEALSTLESKLSNLRSSVRALSDSDALRAYAVSSSDTDYLTAEATNDAFEGNHTVVINQLATSERWVHTAGKEYAEDYVGVGTFIYSYNHKETSITTTATTTLQDMVGLINNDANNPGVTAGLLYFNDAYHLVLSGNDAGSDYTISVNASSTKVLKSDSPFTQGSDNATLSTKITELDQFTVNNGLQGDEQIQITGTDHDGVAIDSVPPLPVNSNTKLEHLIGEINDAFDGTAKAVLENGKIVLTDDTYGTSQLSILLTYDPGSGNTDLTLPDEAEDWDVTDGGTPGVLSGFAASDFILSQAAQDSKIKVDGYPLGPGVAEVQKLSGPKAEGGTFTLTYDGETTVAMDRRASTDTIQAALEALSNVEVGDIRVSGGKLDNAGEDTEFTFRHDAGDVSMISIDASLLNPTTGWTFSEDPKGDNTNCFIRRSSNTVDDVIYGVTLHLHDTTDAGGEELTLTRDIQSVKDKLDSLVIAYNSAVNFIKEKTGYNEVNQTAGVLMGDYVVSTIRYKFREPLIEQTAGFIQDIDAFLTPLHLGFDLDKDGVLSLDANKFDEAIAEDYMGVLAVIGADKTGSSTSDTIEFYGAHSDYTTAGEYSVQVTVSGGAITSAQIRLSDESTYRDATYSGNIVTGNSTFDSNGDPVYAENSLQLAVDLSTDDEYTATVRVKQGFTGKIEDQIDRMLKVTTGSLVIGREHVEDQIEELEEKIELEEYRLTQRETRLIRKFAHLEKVLALLQNQMAAAGILNMNM